MQYLIILASSLSQSSMRSRFISNPLTMDLILYDILWLIFPFSKVLRNLNHDLTFGYGVCFNDWIFLTWWFAFSFKRFEQICGDSDSASTFKRFSLKWVHNNERLLFLSVPWLFHLWQDSVQKHIDLWYTHYVFHIQNTSSIFLLNSEYTFSCLRRITTINNASSHSK